ncbi:glycosyltransferase family 4 protein [Niveispirillum sp.]|uniref:glycosyltransferase family 4 protein n=1 Tax=Niveispirillum sp. TaxID=1917217 RepID=UPI001B69E607|nr:MraY family glycosyltransferase [Niveispirillum sp.]MBP7339056.1 undecaprenyl/decaprenyl-phosphate alpha-N-acetylglucosaminyl 1-phosphate transferase [Niveispirillum sp.]
MDKPDSLRKLHRGAVPLVGGLAILLPAMLIGGGLSYLDGVGLHWVIAPVMAVLFVMGMLDDRQHLPPVVRLSVSLVMFSFAIILAPQLALTGLDFGGGTRFDIPPFMGAMLTIVSLVGFQYAFNMSDGANGIASGTAMIWGLFFATAGAGTLSMLALLIVAGGAVFLIFNMRGRIFLGDSGAYGVSAVMGLLGLAITSHPDSSLTNMQLMGLFLLPVVDCLRLIVSRLRAGRAPFSPDREHLHHYLLRWLVSPTRTALAYWTMVAVPNAAGVLIGGVPGFMATLVLTLTLYRLAIARTAAVPAPAAVVSGEVR